MACVKIICIYDFDWFWRSTWRLLTNRNCTPLYHTPPNFLMLLYDNHSYEPLIHWKGDFHMTRLIRNKPLLTSFLMEIEFLYYLRTKMLWTPSINDKLFKITLLQPPQFSQDQWKNLFITKATLKIGSSVLICRTVIKARGWTGLQVRTFEKNA